MLNNTRPNFDASATNSISALTLIRALDDDAKWSALYVRQWAAHLLGLPCPQNQRESYVVRDASETDLETKVLPVMAYSLANMAVSREGMAHENGIARLSQVLPSAFSLNLKAFSIRLGKAGSPEPEPTKAYKTDRSHSTVVSLDTASGLRYALACWKYVDPSKDILDETKGLKPLESDATATNAIGGLLARETSSPDHDDCTLVGIEAIDASVDRNDNIVGDAAVYADRLTARSMRAASRRDRKTIRWMRKLLITQSRILKRRDATIASLK